MNMTSFSILCVIIALVFVVIFEIMAVILVAGFIASWLGLTGIMWWAVAIVVFMLINGVIGVLSRL